MVYPGANRDFAISGRLPITMVTAMVSPSARVSQHADPDHLPARRTQRQNSFSLVLRNNHQNFAGDRRDNRNDHDRQDDSSSQHPDSIGGASEQPRPTESFAQKRLDIAAHKRT